MIFGIKKQRRSRRRNGLWDGKTFTKQGKTFKYCITHHKWHFVKPRRRQYSKPWYRWLS